MGRGDLPTSKVIPPHGLGCHLNQRRKSAQPWLSALWIVPTEGIPDAMSLAVSPDSDEPHPFKL